uniref:Uncharacterized protein n=1 Tax=Brassica campestris TaxID=3711 RepID=A0A3P5XZL2_BRACM|nr:unnamed protein product [Brassica rapa]
MVYTFFSVDPWILAARPNEYHGALRSGNLYLNSTPATKFYLDTNILAIEAFTNRLSHVHVSIAGLHTYIAKSNNQLGSVLQQNGGPYVSCTGCSRKLDKSWSALYRNKCVSPKIAGVLRLMAVEVRGRLREVRIHCNPVKQK